MRLRRPPELEMGSSLNESQSEFWAGVERIPLVPTDSSVSLLNLLIDEGEGLDAKKRR